jgi:hypothetical protein
MVPMVEEISFTVSPPIGRAAAPESVTAFLRNVALLQQQPVITMATENETGDLTSKVLPNPLGQYDHAIDTAFNYSHFSYVYLTAGYHTFTTSSSTIARSLTVFYPSNYTYSWSNVNSGPGGESLLSLFVAQAGYYSVMLRPYITGTGTTTINLDGNTLVQGAVIGGKIYPMSAVKGGLLNFFTCRITGDTRMIVSRYFASSARGYNDDYFATGDFVWGLASRIKKDFATDSVQYGFVCSYSPTSTGVTDIYLGNANSDVYGVNYSEFPLLKADDAIKAAPSSGIYNCISWAGGITSSWSWPPSYYSTYNCNSGAEVVCFDNFFGNSPVRYPGAWNYTRTGVTVNNAVVDLWKLNAYFTHASVRKPGNNHPHGYDWESKPGGLTRTFHPRNALTNLSFGYGAVVNNYRHTGTYARGTDRGFETDADAVKAGVAIFDVARLTDGANKKLQQLMSKTEFSFSSRFNELYEAWKKTWEVNAMYSDPAAYCKNAEHAAMAEFARTNPRQAMILVFDKFVNGGDHLIGELLWTLTNEKYSYLLTEVKTERAAKPNDEAGRYRIHGDHDNGVLYVEKILRLLNDETVVTMTDDISVVVSPNPVKDRLTVQVITTRSTRVSVTAISAQTRLTRVMQPETMLPAGTHRFNLNMPGFAGTTGDIIAIQVMVDGVMKTVKVLVAK